MGEINKINYLMRMTPIKGMGNIQAVSEELVLQVDFFLSRKHAQAQGSDRLAHGPKL